MKYCVRVFVSFLSLFAITACGSESPGSASGFFPINNDFDPKTLRAPNRGEEIYRYLFPNIQRYLDACFSAPSDCEVNEEQKEIIRQILLGMEQERNGDGLLFRSGKLHPELFELDNQGKPRAAVTGNNPGDAIYVNSDYFEGLAWNNAIALLVHELGHHYGIKDHALLDRLGLKVAIYAEQFTNNIEYPNLDQKPFHLYTFSWATLLTQHPYHGKPQILFDDGLNIHDVSEAFLKAIPCPTALPYPLFFKLSEAFWDENEDRNAAHLRARFVCTDDPNSGPQRMLNDIDVEMRFEFSTYTDGMNARIIPGSITVQSFLSMWTIENYFFRNNPPLFINRIMQEFYPLPEGGFQQVFRTRVETSPLADDNKDAFHCYAYLSFWKPYSTLGIRDLEFPADECTFTKVEDHVYDIEIKAKSTSFDPNNRPVFSRLGLHFDRVLHPQEGEPLFRTAFHGTPQPRPQSSFQRAWFSIDPFGPATPSPMRVNVEENRYINLQLAGSEKVRAVYLVRKEIIPGALPRVRLDKSFANLSMVNPRQTVTPDRRFVEELKVNGNQVAFRLKLFERGMGFAHVERIEYEKAIIIMDSMQTIEVNLSNLILNF